MGCLFSQTDVRKTIARFPKYESTSTTERDLFDGPISFQSLAFSQDMHEYWTDCHCGASKTIAERLAQVRYPYLICPYCRYFNTIDYD